MAPGCDPRFGPHLFVPIRYAEKRRVPVAVLRFCAKLHWSAISKVSPDFQAQNGVSRSYLTDSKDIAAVATSVQLR